MDRKLSFRGFVAASAVAGTLLLAGCEQQGQGSGGGALAGTSEALTAGQVIPTAQACVPTGKHAEHGVAFGCTTCHQCAGTLSFDAAVAGPTAAFDATTKTCSNVACHAVPAGTYNYTVWDWGVEDYVAMSVPYGGQAGSGTANWYAAPGGSGCTACHDFTPTYGGVRYPWHSGSHGNQTIANGNTCQLCHPDATGAYVYGSYTGTSGGLISSCPPGTYCAAGGTITDAALHGNGVVDVTPRWTRSCFPCH